MTARLLTVLAIIASLLFITSSWIQTVGGAPVDDGPTPEMLEQLQEVPDDPPGQPALPVPGAEPAPRPRFGRFTSVQVNVAEGGANIPGDAANEPSIAVDPTNPLHMAIGWRQFDTVNSNFRQAGWAYSVDGGRTWTFPGVLDPGNFRSDPVLDFDNAGNFYYNSLRSNFDCDVFTSVDAGASWGDPVFAYGGDKEWLTVDRSGGIGEGNLYSNWAGSNHTFTRSIDGGESFASPTSITPNPNWGTGDVGPDGVLHITGVSSSNYSIFYVARSTDAQDPADPAPSFAVSTVDLGGNFRVLAGPNPGGLLAQPWIAVDPSDGETAGYIYLLCAVEPPGSDPLDVHFVRSTDGGLTWSEPVRVNDDIGTDAWQWFATMSVGHDGRIDVVWNDSRNTGVVNESELFYASSEDGGETWSENQQLSPAWNSHIGWPNQNKIGDYYEMVSDRVGADLAWAATFNGEQDLYYLRIGDYDCNGNAVGDSTDIAEGTSPDENENGIPDECEGSSTAVGEIAAAAGFSLQAAPNPFNPRTTISFAIDHPQLVAISIFDMTGKQVSLLTRQIYFAGTHSVAWNGRDAADRDVPSGTYIVRLETESAVQAKKVMLLR